jgi:hypothetical protein
MNWSDIGGTVAKAAPILGGLVGGPAGAAVGALIAAKFGVDNTPEAVSTALATNPDAYVKLKEIEANNKVQLQQLIVAAEQNRLAAQTAQYQADASDRASARNLAIEDKDHTARNLAYAYTGALFLVIAAHLYIIMRGVAVDSTGMALISTLEGVLISMVLGSKEFYFGSSSSAVKQQAAITSFATTPGTVTAPLADSNTTTIQTQAPVSVDASDNKP